MIVIAAVDLYKTNVKNRFCLEHGCEILYRCCSSVQDKREKQVLFGAWL